MNDLEQLESEFNKINSDSEKFLSLFLKNALASAAKIVTSKGAIYNFSPYETEQSGFKLGKEIKNNPKSKKNVYVYHFDSADKILFIYEYGKWENIIDKDFFFYEAGGLKRICFTSTNDLGNISISYFKKNVATKKINWGKYGWSVFDYHYNNNILEKISVQQKEHSKSIVGTHEVIFYYEENKLEKIVNVFPNGYEEKMFP